VPSYRRIIRSLGWNKISVAISLLIFFVAASTLYHVFRNIQFGKVFAAIEAQSDQEILCAGGFVVAGYVFLTFYDVFALRTIGKNNVPFLVAAFASFTSSTIGHALGAATVTGGIVRLRIYSGFGLSAVDIAKIAVITGITFWLGNALVLGGAMSFAAEAASMVDHLPSWINRSIGLAALSAIACYLIWLIPRRRALGHRQWRIVLPNARFTLVQIAIGAAELTLVALAMYSLLPPSPKVAFPTVLVIFLTATLLGTISHAPGSLGIMEAAMLIGLPQFQKEELLATLLTFRILYFVIPLFVATIALGLRELRLVARRVTTRDHSRQTL